MEENSIDSMVTDPPAGISFMNKSWDDDKGGREHWIQWMSEVMSECLRVLKPGAHGLVWSIPRTSHWTATALENCGFEIRDVITHLFGSGFPKSLDVSKAIDKMHGAEREVVGIDLIRAAKLVNQKDGCVDSRGYFKAKQNVDITTPSTDDAIKWQGWGTALKPAAEFWWLVRKPIEEKTVAKNVLKHGTGGINIDGCRINTQEKLSIGSGKSNTYGQASSGDNPGKQHSQGRFPANLILDEEAGKLLDEQSGVTKSGVSKKHHNSYAGASNTKFLRGFSNQTNQHGGEGGASRFFYCAKVSSSERGEGNHHPTVKPIKLMSYLIKLITPPNGTVLDPFMGSGSTGIAAKQNNFKFVGIEKEKEYFEIAKKRIR